VTSRVIVSLRVAATPQRAFEVFARDIGIWWHRTICFALRRAHPARSRWKQARTMAFTETLADGKVFEIGRVTSWEPGRRLALSWRQATFAPD